MTVANSLVLPSTTVDVSKPLILSPSLQKKFDFSPEDLLFINLLNIGYMSMDRMRQVWNSAVSCFEDDIAGKQKRFIENCTVVLRSSRYFQGICKCFNDLVEDSFLS